MQIRVLGSDLSPLLEDIGADNLPVEYGGTYTGPYRPMYSLSDDALRASLGFQSLTIPAGGTVSREVHCPIVGGDHSYVAWMWHTDAHDVDCTVEFRPTPSTSESAATHSQSSAGLGTPTRSPATAVAGYVGNAPSNAVCGACALLHLNWQRRCCDCDQQQPGSVIATPSLITAVITTPPCRIATGVRVTKRPHHPASSPTAVDDVATAADAVTATQTPRSRGRDWRCGVRHHPGRARQGRVPADRARVAGGDVLQRPLAVPPQDRARAPTTRCVGARRADPGQDTVRGQ